MELPEHDLYTLFEQLGLENSDQAIEAFIAQHKPIPSEVLLQEADFWSPAQAAFIKEALDDDADWAIVVDTLDSMLR